MYKNYNELSYAVINIIFKNSNYDINQEKNVFNIYPGFIKHSDNKEVTIYPEGSLSSLEEITGMMVLKNKSEFDRIEIKFDKTEHYSNTILQLLESAFPTLRTFDNNQYSFFNMSATFNVKEIPGYLLKLIKRYGEFSLFALSFYFNNLDKFLSSNKLNTVICNIFFSDHDLSSLKSIDNLNIKKLQNYYFLSEDLYQLSKNKFALNTLFKIDLNKLYVIESEFNYSVMDLESPNNPTDFFEKYGTAYSKLKKNMTSLIWAISLTSKYRAPIVGEFVLASILPYDIHCFINKVNINQKYREKVPIDSEKIEALYNVIRNKDFDFFNNNDIAFSRFNNNECYSDEVNSAIDLRIALELLTGVSDKSNKTVNFQQIINRLLPSYEKTKLKKMYRNLSKMNHHGKVISDIENILSEASEICKKLFIKKL